MWTKFAFVAGIGVGYVLGARAGRDRYDTLKAQADALWHDPRVQEKVSAAGHAVKDKAPEVGATITGTAGARATDASTHSESEAGTDDLLIGSEPGSDYTPAETKFNSAP